MRYNPSSNLSMNGCTGGSNNITATTLLLVLTPVREFLFASPLLLWNWILQLLIPNVFF